MNEKIKKPEWTPENAGSEFATHVLPAVQNDYPKNNKKQRDDKEISLKKDNHLITPKKNLALNDYKEGILSKDKTILARAITLIESNADKHFDIAQELIKEILPYTGKSIRIGITGVPGAGKSTFIETLGLYLIQNKKTPAILAIDPSSTISKGSILGDKTRMEILAKNDDAFIRPSPSSGNLGGVARKTRETMLLCEAAGFDVIIIETVGVGQSEVTVRSMVDFFLLILIAGAGDELQGIKKGVIELADAILINKADGDNIISAESAKSQYNNALHYLADATPGWKTKAFTCSAIENKGIDDIWQVINDYISYTKKKKLFADRRILQTQKWFESMLNEAILNNFYKKDTVKDNLQHIIDKILNNEITPVVGVRMILDEALIRK
ncbi:MAG: methylmalonyl Co-A mutase-associated GTPase MeaB [Candidatus Cloacimonetes bacterium]|nr:methylmalonyl Co-A mutase-associated GTPase MeaB [Candidatus Cloacimonadota bacterium]